MSSLSIIDKPILLTERLLHEGYDHKSSIEEKKSLVVSLKRLDAKTN
jgi:hypothetical protein